MAYVSPNCPLPRNSRDPITQCEADRAARVVNGMESAVKRAQWASSQIAGPNSFRGLGPTVVIDVARSQNALAGAIKPVVISKKTNVAGEFLAAPHVLPLNVTEAEYASCCLRGTGPIQPMKLAPQKVIMPEMAAAPISLPASPLASAPTWKNICWALRNGAYDASQFNPDDLMKAQFRCSQLGYTGACVPPPLVALYLDQQRRAGTLPHLSVGDLSAIPQAPDMSGVNCPTSWKMGGLTGYRTRRRGLGAPWGDAGSLPCGPTWGLPKANGEVSGGTGWGWLLLAAAGVGLYAAGKR